MNTYSSSTQEGEAEGPGVQGPPHRHRELKARLKHRLKCVFKCVTFNKVLLATLGPIQHAHLWLTATQHHGGEHMDLKPKY